MFVSARSWLQFLESKQKRVLRPGVCLCAVACQLITLAMRDDLVIGIVYKMGALGFRQFNRDSRMSSPCM